MRILKTSERHNGLEPSLFCLGSRRVAVTPMPRCCYWQPEYSLPAHGCQSTWAPRVCVTFPRHPSTAGAWAFVTNANDALGTSAATVKATSQGTRGLQSGQNGVSLACLLRNHDAHPVLRTRLQTVWPN